METDNIQERAKKKKNRKLSYFLLSFLLAIGITYLLQEPAFTPAQTNVFFLLIFSISLWLTEAVPPYSVGLLIIAFLAYSLGYEKLTSTPVDISIYTGTFSSSVIWLLLGGFFLASAMTKTKLDADLIRATLRVCGTQPKWILFGIMMVTMVSSMLISNTATSAMVVAALMPLLAQFGVKSPVSKGLILGVPIAATTGGMGTLIGSPPNAIAATALSKTGVMMDFINWMYYGLPLAFLLTILSWFVLVRIFMKETKSIQLENSVEKETDKSGWRRGLVIIVLLVTLFFWLTGPIHHLSAAAVSAIPLVVLPMTGLLGVEDIRGMSWDTLILVAGGLSLGLALEHTGLMELYAERIASLHFSNLVFYLLFAYVTMILSNIMSNTACSTVFIPLGMAIFPENITEITMIIGLAASTALLLPVSTPPNAIAFSTGYIEQKDFRIGGLLIGLIGPLLVVFWVFLISLM